MTSTALALTHAGRGEVGETIQSSRIAHALPGVTPVHELKREKTMFLAGCLSKRSSFATISNGERTFEHKGIVVKPSVVLFDKSRKLLSIVEGAICSDPRAPSQIDCLSAQVSAYVVTRAIRQPSLRRVDVRLYLGYPGNVQTEIEARLREIARTIREYQRRRRDRTGLTKGTIAVIPGQALAYTFSASLEYGRNAWSHHRG